LDGCNSASALSGLFQTYWQLRNADVFNVELDGELVVADTNGSNLILRLSHKDAAASKNIEQSLPVGKLPFVN
jgi:hypothetical protein